MRYAACLALLLLCVAPCASAQVPVVGKNGETLESLTGTDTLVTVMLKVSGARDRNLKVIGVGETFISFMTEHGERTAHRIDSIQEIRIQEQAFTRRQNANHMFSLSPEDAEIVKRAKERTLEIFGNRSTNQPLRMKAASIIASTGDRDALAYLEAFAAADDVLTAIYGSIYLYIAGGTPDAEILSKGLASGNLKTRTLAARLTGVLGETTNPERITAMLKDSVPALFAAGAVASAGLQRTEDIETLVERGLRALNEEKGEAAVFALSQMGGAEVRRVAMRLLEESRGMQWFRVVQLLAATEDEEGLKLMRTTCLEQPVFAPPAAIWLARRSDWAGLEYTRKWMKKARDPNRMNLLAHARAASALIEGGHLEAKAELQELLNMSGEDVFERGALSSKQYKAETVKGAQITVCNLMAALGQKTLISLMRPVIENADPAVALAACETAVALKSEDYGQRLGKARLFISVANPDYKRRLTSPRFRFELP